MCSAGSIRPPSTKITKTIASTDRWQSNPMSSSREKKREKNIGRRRRVMAPTFCRPCWMSLTWLSDDYGNSIPTIDPVSCMFGSFSSPLTICVRLSHSPKLKKKKKKKKITSGQLASCPSTLAFFLFGPFRVTSHCRWREREHGCWSVESPCVAIRHQTRRQRSRGGEEEKWRRWINKVHSAQQRGGKDGRLVLLLCLGWFPDVRLFISHAHRQTHEV